MDDWAEIRHLFASGMHSKRGIAKRLGVSRGTVDRALASDRQPIYQRPPTVSSFEAFAPQVRALLVKTPTMPASTLAERVGWTGGPSQFRAKVAEIRPEYVPPDPADRLNHEPGAQVQCDLWFPHEPLPIGDDQSGTPPVLVMTSSHSGFIQAQMLPTRTTSDLLCGMWSLLQDADAVPARLLWDNESGIGRRKLTEAAVAFAGALGTEIKLLPPRDPESKGMVERMNRFFRQGFMPGREFSSPQDFNAQLLQWLPKANARWSRARRAKPSDLIVVDRRAMRPLPLVSPSIAFRNVVRLPRDYYVRVFSNDYSVDPAMIGRIVDVTADLSVVTVIHDGVVVSSHERRWAKQLTVTDPEHVTKAAELRRQFQLIKGQHRAEPDVVEVRELSSYDEAFGIADDDAVESLAAFS